MKLDKNTLIGAGIGIAIGYTLCYFMKRNTASISLGVDGKPLPSFHSDSRGESGGGYEMAAKHGDATLQCAAS
jgi:hypothetical protein